MNATQETPQARLTRIRSGMSSNDAAAWREQPEAALYHVCAGCESFAANSS